jgi:hypothetical protein
MKQRAAKEQKLKERNTLLRAWRKWHAEQLEEVLKGVHRDVFERLMKQLKDLRSARKVVDFIAAQNWAAVDHDARFIALHEINNAIVRLREASALTPIDDPLPGQPESAFRIIKTMFENFPPNTGEHAKDNLANIGASNEEGCIEKTGK